MTRGKAAFYLLALGGLVGGAYYLYPPAPRLDIDSQMRFLKQDKLIEKRDFSLPLLSLIPTNEAKEALDEVQTESNKGEEKLALEAILDNKILLNGKWIALGQEVWHGNKRLVLVSIRPNGIWLRKTEELEDKSLIFVPLIGGQEDGLFSLH